MTEPGIATVRQLEAFEEFLDAKLAHATREVRLGDKSGYGKRLLEAVDTARENLYRVHGVVLPEKHREGMKRRAQERAAVEAEENEQARRTAESILGRTDDRR